MKKIFSILLIVFLSANLFSQTMWFVDEFGSDLDGDGTFENEFATISHAISVATSGDIIYVTGTITGDGITEDGIVIDKDITILGERFYYSNIQAAATENSADRKVFTINSGVTANFFFLNIRNGKSTSNGGGICILGNLNMEECIVENNMTTQLGGGIWCHQGAVVNINNSNVRFNLSENVGGGIGAWEAALNIDNSAIYQNDALQNGAGIYIYNSANDNVYNFRNTTIYDNSTMMFGGGIYIGNYGGNITTNIQNVTIAGNTSSANTGNGLHLMSTVSNTLYIQNCIISNGTTSNYSTSGAGTITVNRINTICRDNTMPYAGIFGNLNNTDPLFEDFGIFGGLTPVCRITSGSPARNAGSSDFAAPETDQRGATREGTIDIGAFEWRTPLAESYTINNEISTTYPSGSNFNSFEEAVNALNFGGIITEIYFYAAPNQIFTEPPLYIYGTNFEFPVNFTSDIMTGDEKPVIYGTDGIWQTGVPSTVSDAVFYLLNPTDVHIINLEISDNIANTTSAQKMEFGIAMLGEIVDNWVESCIISLNTDYYSTFGIILYSKNISNYNSIVSNEITDCNIGIALINENTEGGQSNEVFGNTLSNIGVNNLIFPSGGIMTNGQSQIFIYDNIISNAEGNILFGILSDNGSSYIYNNQISDLNAEMVMPVRFSGYGNDDVEISGNTVNNVSANQYCMVIVSEVDSVNGQIFITDNEINTITSPAIIGIMSNNISEIDNNILSDFEATDYLIGIAIDDTCKMKNVISNNNITDFTGTSETYINAINTSSNSYNEIFNNKISNFFTGNANSVIIGINSASDSTNVFYNNLIYDLRTPFFNSLTGIGLAAISLNGGVNELYYNTLFLDYISQTANNANCLLLINSEIDSLKMNNNIFVNNTDVTTGKAAIGIINLTQIISNFSETTDNNLYYIGSEEGSVKQVVYNDGTLVFQTLASYIGYLQAEVSPVIENLSIAENPPFISNVNPYDFHISAGSETGIQNGAVRITNPPITSDLDGKLRFGETGYTNTGTAPDLGVYEIYEPFLIATDANNITEFTATLNGSIFPYNSELTDIEFEYGDQTGVYTFNSSATPSTVSGSNETSINANITDLFSGHTYYFRVKAICGLNTYYSDENVFTTVIVNIAENKTSDVKIYPNPAKNKITISSVNIINNVKISDLSGKIILNENTSANNVKFDIENYNSGIYLIEIQSGGNIFYEKLIKY